jgi:hypothetical protein
LNTGLKLMFFFVRKLTGIVIVILLIILATFIAYDMANIYVVANDGLTQRAETIINRQDPTDLNRFFTLKYLNSDSLFYSDQYRDYLITGYDYELKIKKLWVWPWQSRTEVIVEEYIPEPSWKFSITDELRERLIAEQTPKVTEAEGDEEGTEGTEEAVKEVSLNIPAPKWQNGEKMIEFRKIDGQWKIDRIVFVKGLNQDISKK